jgi:hypothetical protein
VRPTLLCRELLFDLPSLIANTAALLSGIFQTGQNSVVKKQGFTSIDLAHCGK